jgi:hypothetical protein
MSKKKFSETKVGQFLAKSAPGILGTVGDILPDNGVLGVVKNLISKEDSFEWSFTVSTGWVDLLQTLLVTVYVAYFGSRGAEKFQTIKNKK